MTCGVRFRPKSSKTKYCNLVCRSKSSVWKRNLAARPYPRGIDNPATKFRDISEKEARELFEDYKASNVDINKWAESKGTHYPQIVALFRRYFPAEYEDFVEYKMNRKTSAYERGRKFEWRVRDYFRKLGYYVLRSPQSAGPADLIAIKKDERILLIQCKLSGKMPPAERCVLGTLAESIGAKALLISRMSAQDKYGLEIKT